MVEDVQSSRLQEPAPCLAPGALGIGMGIQNLLRWLRAAPAGTTIPAATLAELLDGAAAVEPTPPPPPSEPIEFTWRERLWLVPAETRLATRDVCEALDKSRSWLYGHLAEHRGPRRLPHRKLDGELVFVAGEVRAWLRATEDIQTEGPMESPAHERRLFAVEGGR